MAHVRREFKKALAYDAQKAGTIMKKIQELYAIDRRAREGNLTHAQRKELRLEESLKLMNELGKMIVEKRKTAIPMSPMEKALSYSINRWDSLLNYLSDGALELDNNWIYPNFSIIPTSLPMTI